MRTFRFPEVVPHFNSNATVANCESSVCNNYGMTPVVDRVPFEMEFDTHAAAPTKALYVNEKESTRLDGQTAIDASVPNVSVPPDGNCFYIAVHRWYFAFKDAYPQTWERMHDRLTRHVRENYVNQSVPNEVKDEAVPKDVKHMLCTTCTGTC